MPVHRIRASETEEEAEESLFQMEIPQSQPQSFRLVVASRIQEGL